MTKNSQILETLQWQPISREEMERRHILGRLYGPIATFGEPTRNGRFYNKELWTKALSDEIFLEKVANKNLLLELEHPTDRDQLDAKQACACIPEIPKIVGNDLYAIVDILDLPNGRILKNLIDYGYVPGISSRGSGDVDANDSVDPETFFLETWDIVSLPAVKKARLSVCESLTKGKTLKMALRESLENSSEEDRKIMKETLKKMDIKIEESDETLTEAEAVFANGTPKNSALLPVSEISDDEFAQYESLEEDAEEDEIEEVEAETEDEVPAEDAETEETEDADENSGELTVASIIKDFETLDEDKLVVFENVEIDGVEYETTVEIGDETEDTVTLKTVLTPVEQDEDKDAEDSDDEEDAENADDETEEAVDDGDEEVVESFKDLVRQKDLLESKVKTLMTEKTVSDAKVKELQESLDKYKAAFARTSELAAKAKEYKGLNESLNTQLAENKEQIAELKNRVKTNATLTESINGNTAKLKTLTEKYNALQANFTDSKTKLEEQVAQANKKLQERTDLARKYKTSYLQVVERYIVSKAKLLGVKPAEITSKLNESYTLDDIDAACDTILTESVGMKRLPFANNNKARVKINESKLSEKISPINPDNGYEVDDSLLELAGLK